MIRNGIPYGLFLKIFHNSMSIERSILNVSIRIPFVGPELTGEETDSKKTKENRGLLFVAYQSEIADGFQLVQKVSLSYTRYWMYFRGI
jgi:hypothetical protein